MTDPLMTQAVTALSRGHNLFAGETAGDHLGDVPATTRARADEIATHAAGLPSAAPSIGSAQQLRGLADSDQTFARLASTARADHTDAKTATRAVLEAARADAAPAGDTALGRREAIARMAARLRTQHRHIANARRRARLHAARVRRLRYRHPRMAAGRSGGRPAVLAAIRKALDIKGIHDPAARARWERGMDLVARRESNYNAHAVNDWDANAANGTPSKGAWQFIAPTFAAYHQPGTSPDIRNLVAQACAFINYAMGRYGVAADASNLADRIQQADPRRSPKGY